MEQFFLHTSRSDAAYRTRLAPSRFLGRHGSVSLLNGCSRSGACSDGLCCLFCTTRSPGFDAPAMAAPASLEEMSLAVFVEASKGRKKTPVVEFFLEARISDTTSRRFCFLAVLLLLLPLYTCCNHVESFLPATSHLAMLPCLRCQLCWASGSPLIILRFLSFRIVVEQTFLLIALPRLELELGWDHTNIYTHDTYATSEQTSD